MTIAVGFFDGVHLGHQRILSGADAAFTFENHPLTILNPSKAPSLIMSKEERITAIRACGVKSLFVLPFTKDLAQESPSDFVERLKAINDGKGDLHIRAGKNWSFGCGGKGDADFLRSHNIDITLVPYEEFNGEIISSTRIRAALNKGELENVSTMLGRDWSLFGEVIKGKGEGAKLGFPTVNLKVDNVAKRVKIPLGVYEVEAEGLKAIANYGLAPTFNDKAWKEPIIEIHFLDGIPNLSSCLNVSFKRFIRPEMKFESREALVCQIKKDILMSQGENV